SFLPRIDLERYCLWDTVLSSIFLGRTAATIAEISFAGQISLFLHRLGEVHYHPWCRVLALSLVPAITIAQCFCWCGVVTLNHGYHAIEESIWAIGSLLVGLEMASLVVCHPDCSPSLFYLGVVGSFACFAFFWFMVTVDGGKDAMHRRVVTKSWHVWKEETVWLTGYFSSAVWLSLFLIHLQVPA
ncbi:hypothetical protein ACHAW5_004695, partial [Stephanodiscus triporus]